MIREKKKWLRTAACLGLSAALALSAMHGSLVEEHATDQSSKRLAAKDTIQAEEKKQLSFDLITVGGKTFHNYLGGLYPGGCDYDIDYNLRFMRDEIKKKGGTWNEYYNQDMDAFCEVQEGQYTAKSIKRLMKEGYLLEFIDLIRKESFNGTPTFPYQITANWTVNKPVGTVYYGRNGVRRKVVAPGKLYMSVNVPKECFRSVTVHTQKELDAAIKKINVKKLWTITIQTDQAVDFVIPKKTFRYYGPKSSPSGYYRSRLQTTTVVLDAPNATLTNNGNLRAVKGITKIKDYIDRSPDVDIYDTWRPAEYCVYE